MSDEISSFPVDVEIAVTLSRRIAQLEASRANGLIDHLTHLPARKVRPIRKRLLHNIGKAHLRGILRPEGIEMRDLPRRMLYSANGVCHVGIIPKDTA